MSINEQWEKIPNFSYGETPDDLPDENPRIYRLACIKRGLIGAYGDSINDAQEAYIIDMLADLRHLCDTLRLDFASCDKAAYMYYVKENSAKGWNKDKQENVQDV